MREVIFVVDRVLKDLREFPDTARQTIGYAISEAEVGRLSADAKPMSGYTADGVFEVVADDNGDTYRSMYAVKIDDAIYVLHCFQKKSPRGSVTPKQHLKTLEARLARAKEISAERAALAKKAEGEARETGKKGSRP